MFVFSLGLDTSSPDLLRFGHYPISIEDDMNLIWLLSAYSEEFALLPQYWEFHNLILWSLLHWESITRVNKLQPTTVLENFGGVKASLKKLSQTKDCIIRLIVFFSAT